MSDFWKAIRRKKSFQIATVYAVTGWGIIQVAQTTFEPLGIPGWALRLIIVVVIMGFPIALIAGWILVPRLDESKNLDRSELAFTKVSFRKWIVLGCMALISSGMGYAFFVRTATEADKSIAVIPFTNMSNNPDLEYLGDGLQDDILDQLQNLSDLKVKSRTSTLKYKHTQQSIQEIGKELGVSTIVEGSIRKFQDTYRVNIQLIDVASGDHLFSKVYDFKGKDILNIMSEVAHAAAVALSSTLSFTSTVKPTLSPEAYKLFLRGRFYWNLRTGKYLQLGINFFQEAITLDPNYAQAYAGLADCYTALGYLSVFSPEETFPKARTAAYRALQLDSSLAEPHTSLGYIKFYYDWDWVGAEREFKKAIALDPKYPISYQWYGWYLTARQRFGEAENVIGMAEKLDSLSAPISTDMGFSSYYEGKLDKSLQQLTLSLKLSDSLPLTHLIMSRVFQDQKNYDKAIEEGKLALRYAPNWSVALAGLGYIYGVSGREEEAYEILKTMNILANQNKFVTPYGVALIYAGLGKKDQVFEWLEKAYQGHAHWLVWLKLDRRWVGIRSDKRYKDLIFKIGL